MLRALRNLVLFEVLAVTVAIGIIAAVLLNRLSYYQEAAEKANMELVISSIQSALRIRIATMMIEGRAGQYSTLAQHNPMDLLEQKPANYAGLSPSRLNPETLAGTWVFDPESRTLIYWIKHGDHFHPDSTGQRKVRLRIALSTDPAILIDTKTPLVTGARVVLVEPYKWF